jgi:hypothetical protein
MSIIHPLSNTLTTSEVASLCTGGVDLFGLWIYTIWRWIFRRFRLFYRSRLTHEIIGVRYGTELSALVIHITGMRHCALRIRYSPTEYSSKPTSNRL